MSFLHKFDKPIIVLAAEPSVVCERIYPKSTALITCNVCVCISVKCQEWALWQQVMKLILNVCIFKNWTTKWVDLNSCTVFPVIRFDTLMKYQHQVQQQIHSTADTHDLRCTVCHGVFSNQGDLDSHMLTHTQQKLTSPNNLKHKVSSPELEILLYSHLLCTAPTCSLSQ